MHLPPPPPALQAVLFDLDGVLIDSHVQHEKAWEAWSAELGRRLPDGFFKRSFGMRNETIIPELLGWADEREEVERMSFRKEELYREYVRSQGLEPLPGVLALLEGLKAAGIRRAVASSTPRENLGVVMEMTGLGPYFQAIITGSDVSHGKPHPEVFLKAAAALGADPQRCLVIEDAYVGIDAGRAAGCRVLGVGTTHPAESLENAHRAVNDLRQVTVKDLIAMFE